MNGSASGSGSSSSAFGGGSSFATLDSATHSQASAVREPAASGGFSQSSSFGGDSNGAFGGSSSSQTSTSSQPGTNATAARMHRSQLPQTAGTAPGDASSSGQQVVSGGPIVGVASTSKETTIREFNHKRKYNEWQFVYDPTARHGGTIEDALPATVAAGRTALAERTERTNRNLEHEWQFVWAGNGIGSGNSGFSNSGFGGSSTAPAQPPANPPQQQ